MSLITISDLATADSFLNELKKTETTQIFGGWGGGGCHKKVEEPACDYSYHDEEKHCYTEPEHCYTEPEPCYTEPEHCYKEPKHYSWTKHC